MSIARIRLSCDSTVNWEESNPILLAGEAGVEITAENKVLLKIGDGINHWNNLAYQGSDIQAIIDLITANTQAIETNNQAIATLDGNIITINGQIESINQSLEAISNSIAAIKYYNHSITISVENKGYFYLTITSKQSQPLTLSQTLQRGETRLATGVLIDSDTLCNVISMSRDTNDVYTVTGNDGSQELVYVLDISDPAYTFVDNVVEIQ